MKHPFLIIKDLYEITKKLLILETHIDSDMQMLDYPAMRFYPNKECFNDPYNWWGFNIPCVMEMLKSAGFKPKLINHSGNRAVFHAKK